MSYSALADTYRFGVVGAPKDVMLPLAANPLRVSRWSWDFAIGSIFPGTYLGYSYPLCDPSSDRWANEHAYYGQPWYNWRLTPIPKGLDEASVSQWYKRCSPFAFFNSGSYTKYYPDFN